MRLGAGEMSHNQKAVWVSLEKILMTNKFYSCRNKRTRATEINLPKTLDLYTIQTSKISTSEKRVSQWPSVGFAGICGQWSESNYTHCQ
jgi:hypothetical protein